MIGTLKSQHRSLWIKCVCISLALHACLLTLLLRHPIIFAKAWAPFFASSKPTPKYIQADESWDFDPFLLDNFFEEFPAIARKEVSTASTPSIAVPSYEEKPEVSLTLPSLFSKEALSPLPFSFSPRSFMELPTIAEEHSIDLTKKLPVSDLPILQHQKAPISLHEPNPVAYMSELSHEEITISATSPQPIFTDLPFSFAKAPFLEEKERTSITSFTPPSFSVDEPAISLIQKSSPILVKATPDDSLSVISLSDVNDFLPEEMLSTLAWNDDFTVQAMLFPEKEGYVFSVAISPKQEFHGQKIKQNFYFLIDVSSGMENHKLGVFKRSILKALSSLSSSDAFTIFLLDQNVVKFRSQPIKVSPESILLAEEFLETKAKSRSFFSSLHLMKGLSELLSSSEMEEDAFQTALLFSNGKTSLSPQEVQSFVHKNQGKVQLFTAAVGQNNHLTPLDMLSSCSGGKLFYSDTNTAFPRKLSVFLKNLEQPLAKNLSLTMVPSNPKAVLQFPGASQPTLYGEQPFIVMGKIDRLCDIDIILQGKSAEDPIFLKKVLHFEEAETPSLAIKKEWLRQQKLDYYEKFLEENKPVYLKNAQEILRTLYGRTITE